jgi:hypothetical protein
MAHLVKNLLNAQRVDTNGHVHRVDNEAEDLYHLSWQESLCLGHWNTEVCAHLEPKLHLFQCSFICVAASKEIIHIGFEYAQQGCPTAHRHIEDGAPHHIHKIKWGQCVPKRQSRVDVKHTVDVKSKQGPIAFAHRHVAKRLVYITFPDVRSA